MATRVLRETRGGRDEVLAMAVPGHERGTGLQSLEVPSVLYTFKRGNVQERAYRFILSWVAVLLVHCYS
jgi:hypothetical protein